MSAVLGEMSTYVYLWFCFGITSKLAMLLQSLQI